MCKLKTVIAILLIVPTFVGYATESQDQDAQTAAHSVFERYERHGSGYGDIVQGTIADAVIVNGNIYTVNPEQPRAQAGHPLQHVSFPRSSALKLRTTGTTSIAISSDFPTGGLP